MTSVASWDSNLLAGLGPIISLLEDDGITNIQANAFDDVWVTGYAWRGHRHVPEVRWENHEHFRIGCIRVSQVIGRAIGEGKPLLNGRLPGGERVNVAIPPACERIALTIRKFPARPMTFDTLESVGSLDRGLRQICTSLVRARRSILVAGGCGAGKTSLLNALSTVIPPHERVVTVEDARELRIQQENWVAMETVEPYERDVAPVAMGDLVRNVLRQNPDRIVVGEVRGEEAFYMLRAFSSGHRGGLGTVHSNDAEDALHQVQLLAQMAPVSGLNAQVVGSMVGRAIDVVIYQAYFEEENVRRISEIIEVDRPGMVWRADAGCSYTCRRLVHWDEEVGRWTYPQSPSAELQLRLRRQRLGWPAASLAGGGA